MTSEGPPPVAPGGMAALASEFRAANREAAEHRAGLTQSLVHDWLEAHEADLAEWTRGVLGHLADNEDLPGHVRDALGVMLQPEHQAQFFIALFAVQGIISQFVMAAVQPEVQSIQNQAWPRLPVVPLSPAEAALAVVRGVLSMDEGISAAAESGLDVGPFQTLWRITGEPPALQELLLLYRRGQISDQRLLEGVRQSRIRDEWQPEILDLRYAPPSPAEVISGTVEGHLGLAEAVKLFQEAGINPEHFQWMYQTAGRPPGMMEMLTLLNRGQVTEDQVVTAIRESNVKNKYIDALLKLRFRIPPQRTIVSMLRHGVITDEKATTWLLDLGYHPEDVKLFIAEGHAQKTQAEKDLALGTVKTLYADRLISRADAESHVRGLGYDAHEAEMILSLVDVQRARRFTEAAIGRVHTLYVGYHLTRGVASSTMDRLGVEAGERDDLLDIWDLERQANARHLTLAQVQGAAKRGIIKRDDFDRRAAALGYQEADMEILWDEAFAPSKFPGGTP